jgi:hypothetical protein
MAMSYHKVIYGSLRIFGSQVIKLHIIPVWLKNSFNPEKNNSAPICHNIFVLKSWVKKTLAAFGA